MCNNPDSEVARAGFSAVSVAGEAATGTWLGGAHRARRGGRPGLVAGRVAPLEWEELGLLDLHGGKGRRDCETLLGMGFLSQPLQMRSQSQLHRGTLLTLDSS